MNFLAHQFLSFQKPEIQIGNLYGEIVRAKDYMNYPDGIRKGILLHRSIDSFTDSNPIVKKSTRIFQPNYGKYAPVIVDVIYDYFLIKNWNKYSDLGFEDFVNGCYTLFKENMSGFPENLKFIIRHLLNYDWFRNYRSFDGIEETLRGISGRSKFKNNISEAVHELKIFENQLNENFNDFFPLLLEHCKNFIETES